MPGLAKITSVGGFSYTETHEGNLYITGGKESEGTLHQVVTTGVASMRLEERDPMIHARRGHCMTAFGKEGFIVTGGVQKGGSWN